MSGPLPPWDRASKAVVIGLCAIKLFAHLLCVERYGYHGDELYFIECGRHFAFGYVDHPPLIPWLARVADALGGGLLSLRLPAILAGVGTMVCAALLVRSWRGGALAQLLALLCLLISPAGLRMAGMLDIPVVEVFLCSLCAYLVERAISRGERWTWVVAGGALGLAMLAKHSSLVWGGALALGILATPQQRALAGRWPWLGVLVALLMVLPNLVWQLNHGFATLEFMGNMRQQTLAEQGRGLFVAGQLLYFHPLAAPVWIAGLVSAFTRRGQAARPFALLFLVMFGFFFVMGGKIYYLASAYPPLLAAGAVALEAWLTTRAAARRTLVASLVAGGALLAVLGLPLLPLDELDAFTNALFRGAIPPLALTHDLHAMYGWEQHAATVERVYRELPAHERDRASILAGSYAQAAALNLFRSDPRPRALSGHMTYYLWGPDGGRGEVLIAYGLPRALIDRHYRACVESARIEAPLARPYDTDLPVYVCRDPRGTLAELWPALRSFGHTWPSTRPRG